MENRQNKVLGLLLFIFFAVSPNYLYSQTCNVEPGSDFLTSSSGCAPFEVRLMLRYLNSTAGTMYYVDWGDGSPIETYQQTDDYSAAANNGTIIEHTYASSPTDCGYIINIDAENTACPFGSIEPLQIPVVVWTEDEPAVAPNTYRVCAGYAADITFEDNSNWNCNPRPTRENAASRWGQWIYGTGDATNRIPGIAVGGSAPAFPYKTDVTPIYPIDDLAQTSDVISVPATTNADIGKEFEITWRNWNQCNAYDNDVTDGNGLNPVTGDMIDGDNDPVVASGRVVIVESPEPDFVTRKGDASGALSDLFCIDDPVYFDNETPPIAGAGYWYTWEFFDDNTGTNSLGTSNDENPTFSFSNPGQKLITYKVRDINAAGNCEVEIQKVITISPTAVANINLEDVSGNPVSENQFCIDSQEGTVQELVFVDGTQNIDANTRWKWEFFDQNGNLINSYPSTGFSDTQLGPFNRIFDQKGNYLVRLTTKDAGTNCESIDEKSITFYDTPQPDFSATGSCSGEDVLFADASTYDALASEGIISYEWDFDYDGTTFNADQTSSNGDDVTYNYTSSGMYTAALRVTTDGAGCAKIFTQALTINPQPQSAISANTLSGCSDLEVTLNNTSHATQTATINEYRWYRDSGSGPELFATREPGVSGYTSSFNEIFINDTGSNLVYEVYMEAVSAQGCINRSNSLSISVSPAPVTSFVSSDYDPNANNCSPQTYNFSVTPETQSLSPDTYTWTVYDEDTGNQLYTVTNSGTNPSFSYEFSNSEQIAKVYRVYVEAAKTGVCFRGNSMLIRINPIPSGTFTISEPEITCTEYTVIYDADQKGLYQYTWEIINEGNSFFPPNDQDFIEQTYVRPAAGEADKTITVRLTTTNSTLCKSSTEEQTFTIPAQTNFMAAFSATPENQIYPNATVSLINNSTQSSELSYEWDFGDGTIVTGYAPGTHTYAEAGNYIITLTVSDGGCIEQISQQVTISPSGPIADFVFEPWVGCSPLTVYFTNLSENATNYLWDFGDGNTSAEIDPIHSYRSPGIYEVSLTASSDFGEDVLVSEQKIEVLETPYADFVIRPFPVYLPDDEATFINRSTNATSYFWDFGDGNTSTQTNPVHQYETEGDYTITLIAQSENGCADTLTIEGAVETITTGRFRVPNVFSPDPTGPSGGYVDGEVGRNDIFRPLIEGVKEYQLQIFNKWGELLFESFSTKQGWDGYYKDKLCQEDVYVYKIRAVFNNNEETTKVGDVLLLQ
ncbi:PKD domain-containing protein [Mangrovivirga cuniculi]|uniref:PKD domain-containing protein n=1 Tax=Mangrovivirga cuniculi TaxID=2715131 RepID=A0A4D7K1B2_9BACT|nr:PKD domain-containing protein [Mangrovivirga cuniculi]QCK14654.1 hypothetical protein DCC35_07810 [Mangrovivirga cuniculi]